MSIKPSRTALVSFFNETLRLNVAKVDDLGTGAAYCQLLDSIFGDMPMHRVRFDTRNSLEVEQNYKILQQAFLRHKINKSFDSLRLMKCRLQDNLDFSQWLYQFWNESAHIENYDPIARRSDSGSFGQAERRAPSALHVRVAAAPQPLAAPRKKNVQPQTVPVQASEQYLNKTPLKLKQEDSSSKDHRIAALEDEVDELGKTIDILMEERGLYYEKLLDIEQLMNQQIDQLYSTQGNTAAMEHAKDPMLLLIRQIQEILFSSPEGFQPQPRPEDEPF